MPAQTLLWKDPVEISTAGKIGGLLHYFTEETQVVYTNADDQLRTMVDRAVEGNFPGIIWDGEKDIDGGHGITSMRFDHPSFGTLFGAWVDTEDGALMCVVYNYAADVADIIETVEITEKVDNTVRDLSMIVKNAAADMFQDDVSLFVPGAAVEIEMTMGSDEWYPMGKYYLDKAPFDPFATTLSMQGRSRAGRLFADTTFDVLTVTTGAKFSGTPDAIVKAILKRYSDDAITDADIVAQTGGAATNVTFAPDQEVLEGVNGWLSGKDTAEEIAHPVLSRGDNGAEVTLAQKLINKALPSSYTKLVVDGIFGAKTEAAIKYVQGRKGLTVNGTVDEPTWVVLLARPINWRVAELYDGRFVAGQPGFLAKHRPTGRYTFNRGVDVLTREIDRCGDGAYSRVGVKYKSGESELVKYASVDTWPAWAVPSHRTYYEDAPDGATAAQAQTQANNKAVELQYVGIVEQVVGPIRPELLVGDIAQIDNEDGTASVTGIVTEVKHIMGEKGFMTTFMSDSGGAIMDDTVDEIEMEVTATSAVWGGANRKRRMSDLIKVISKRRGRLPILIE